MIKQDIKTFALKALLKRNGPISDELIKGLIRTAFSGVALTDGDLKQWIRELETAELIAGTDDAVLGPIWDLTGKGKIKAQQLS